MDLTEVPDGRFRRHPWEVVRARFFGRVFREMRPLGAPQTVLDVGAGDGYLASALLRELPTGSSVICFDAKYTEADLTRYAATAETGLSFVQRPPTARFDVLMFLDVIEHVPDDRAFLTDLVQRNLAPRGSVLVSVPAWQPLFGQHDEGLMHHRRYSPRACRALLAGSGLSIRRSGGLFHSLLLARLATVTWERIFRYLGHHPRARAHLGDWRGGALLSAVLERTLAADNAITLALTRRGLALPGLSFWAVCDRSDDQAAEPRT
jgi:SAM-dependent methyltransferase